MILSGYSPPPAPSPTRLSHLSFSQFLNLQDQESWCFKFLELSDKGAAVASAIREGGAVAVSDGSYHQGWGSAAWVIEGFDDHGRITGKVLVSGDEKSQSSYRSELTSLYCILLSLHRLCEFHAIIECSIEIGCDGESALAAAFSDGIPSVTVPDFDIISAIFHLRAQLHISLHTTHVKGHQDDHCHLEDLDHLSRLNVAMDKEAKAHLRLHQMPRRYAIPHKAWSL